MLIASILGRSCMQEIQEAPPFPVAPSCSLPIVPPSSSLRCFPALCPNVPRHPQAERRHCIVLTHVDFFLLHIFFLPLVALGESCHHGSREQRDQTLSTGAQQKFKKEPERCEKMRASFLELFQTSMAEAEREEEVENWVRWRQATHTHPL